ncbi:MAG: hypothetical protein LBV69_06190, partial [Bacteroidales bacterium]|nr:hypothetical protein [Bacteroidales bacterium]
MTKELANILNQLQLLQNDAVFFRSEKDGRVFHGFSSELKQKLDSICPDAYYVFNKTPLVLFFDATQPETAVRIKEIHKQVWSFDYSPIIFVVTDKDIEVYNAFQYIKKESKLERLELSPQEIENKFSFWNLESGFFWKWLQEEYLIEHKSKETRKRVNEKLFQNIKEARLHLMEQKLSEEFANSLILRLIFVRYLLDREVEIKAEFISGADINERRKCFHNLILQPERLNKFFEYLNQRFNGVLFKELDTTINKEQSEFLAAVFSGEYQGKDSLFDGYFFEIFDFSIIPVEMISGIYESLINEETKKLNSAVYTPPFLVDYILSDTVDTYLANAKTSECKIFEVAVGSGIFLVQSLRKMIEKEIQSNGREDEKAFSEKIRRIAEDNLFGIDVNKEALKVTCFSIYIALLDYQEPKDIGIYKFPPLIGKNLFQANFFDTEHLFNQIVKGIKPNFILGNPPWKNGSDDPIHVKYLKENKLENIVSDYQLAQSFLLRTKDFSESNPICSLIVTSKAFYNNNATSFKERFLTDFYLKKCLDLSCVRRLIFEKADNPAMVMQYQSARGENTLNNIVYHYSLKHNVFIKNYKMLTFEKNDIKQIKQDYFIKYKWMFKVALYGNALDFNLLVQKTKERSTLDTYLEKHNIHSGNGIKKGGKEAEKKNRKQYFDFLIGLPILKNAKITKYYTYINADTDKLSKEDVYLEAGRAVELFKGKRILFGKRTKHETYINVSLVEENCVFRDSVNAISFNTENELQINLIYSLLMSDLFTYYQYLTTSNWGIYYPEIHKEEFLSFPIIEPNEKTKNELINLVNQFLQPFEEYYKQVVRSESLPINEKVLSNINAVIDELYEIQGYEKDLIDYVLEVSRYQFQESKIQKVIKQVHSDKKYLQQYASIFLEEFSKIYYDQ